MSNPIDDTLSWVREIQSVVSQQIFTLGMRIATWLVLGNTGALVLLFNSQINQQSGNEADFYTMALYFLIGLFTAFVGTVIQFFGSFYGTLILTRSAVLMNDVVVSQYYLDKLEEEGVEVPEDSSFNTTIDNASGEHNKIASKQIWLWISFCFTVAFYLLSAIFFGLGIASYSYSLFIL